MKERCQAARLRHDVQAALRPFVALQAMGCQFGAANQNFFLTKVDFGRAGDTGDTAIILYASGATGHQTRECLLFACGDC